jgi:flagellar hook-length control protein FliK
MGISCRVAAPVAASAARPHAKVTDFPALFRLARWRMACKAARQASLLFLGISPELSVTSVAFEGPVVSLHPMRTDRPNRPGAIREDGGFSALVEGDARASTAPAVRPADRTPARDTAPPAEMAGAENAGTAPASIDSDRGAPAEATGESMAEVPLFAAEEVAPEFSAQPDPGPIVTALPPVPPVLEPSGNPVVAVAAIPAPTAPAVPAPAAAIDPVETALASAPRTAAPQPAPVMPVPPGTDPAKPPAGNAPEQALQAPLQPDTLAPQLQPRAKTSGDTTDLPQDAPVQSEASQAGAQIEAAESDTPKLKPLPAQAAPVRPDMATGKSETRPDFVPRAEDPASAPTPAVDPAAQLATPAHASHPALPQAAAPQATPVSAAQPVPITAIAVEIASQARAGNARFEIRLDPPELGRIDVRLDIDREGNVTSRLVIERADTYDLLRRDQSTLERALQQAGLKTSDHALEFSLRDQGFARQREGDDMPRARQAVIHDAETHPGEAASGYARLLGLRGGIDIRV